MLILARKIQVKRGREELFDVSKLSILSENNGFGLISVQKPTVDDMDRYPNVTIDLVVTVGTYRADHNHDRFVLAIPSNITPTKAMRYLVDRKRGTIVFNSEEEISQFMDARAMRGRDNANVKIIKI